MSSPPSDRAYEPATFVERGAAVPFTTPLLAGARVRRARREGLQVLMANPSGGLGTYIMPWNNVRGLCRPSVYDLKLLERISGVTAITPVNVRRAAHQTSASGLAGRPAAAAATAALAAEEENVVLTNFHLLLRLVQQEEDPGLYNGAQAPGLDLRAKRIIAGLASQIGQAPGTIAASLEDLARLYEPVGVADSATSARLPQTINALKLLRHEALSVLTEADDHATALIRAMLLTLKPTIAAAEHSLAEARSALKDIRALLIAWNIKPGGPSRPVTRLEWLVDGWDRACQIWWLDTKSSARCSAIDEIVSLVPALPRETGDWPGVKGDADTLALPQLRRSVEVHHDWRTGACVHDTIARNETLLAA